MILLRRRRDRFYAFIQTPINVYMNKHINYVAGATPKHINYVSGSTQCSAFILDPRFT